MNLVLFGGRRGSRQKETWITVDQPWKHYGDDILHSGGVGVTLIRGVDYFDRDSCTREVCCSCDSAAVAGSSSAGKEDSLSAAPLERSCRGAIPCIVASLDKDGAWKTAGISNDLGGTQDGSLGKANVQKRVRIDCLWKCET